MKKILLSVAIASASICAFAQSPTWDFEAWTGNEPTGWISENEVMILGNPQSVFKAVAPDVHGGVNAMQITSVTMTSPVSGLPNPIGLAAPGKLVSFVPKFGTPYTGRPASVDFWYKYTPAANDTAEFLLLLWNSGTHDTLAVGYWNTGAVQSTYASQTINLTYNPAFATEFPDSMGLTFSSTKVFTKVANTYSMCTTCGLAGSNLWVDDISFNGWNGINEHPSSNNMILFPNPANDFVNVIADVNEATSIIAYDVTGRMVASTSLVQKLNGMNRKEGVINTSNLSTGLYSYSVLDKSGNILRAGKFNIAR